MKITFNPATLLTRIKAIGAANYVGLVAKGQALMVLGGNAHCRVRAMWSCAVDADGSAWVTAGPLVAALTASKGDEATIAVGPEKLAYRCGHVELDLPVSVSSEDWTQLPPSNVADPFVVVSGEALRAAISIVDTIPAKHTNDWMCGIGIKWDGNGLSLVATDGKRIAEACLLPSGEMKGEFDVATTPKYLCPVPNMTGDVALRVNGSWLFIEHYDSDISAAVRLLERPMPGKVSEKLRESEKADSAQKVNLDSFRTAAALIARNCVDDDVVKLETGDGEGQLSVATSVFQQILPIEGEFALERKVGLTAGYLHKALSTMPDCETVDIIVADTKSPLAIMASGDGITATVVIAQRYIDGN